MPSIPKLTDDQRRLVDDTILAVLTNALEAPRFDVLDARVRAKLHEQLGGWNYRYTDAACQRLRRAGRIISKRQRWRLAPSCAECERIAKEDGDILPPACTAHGGISKETRP